MSASRSEWNAPWSTPWAETALALHPIPAQDDVQLALEERQLADTMHPVRRAAFVAGRAALREAIRLAAPDATVAPLLQTARGAPTLPAGLAGSISHKQTRAIAIAGIGVAGHLGVDLERRARPIDAERPSIATRILTPRELVALDGLDALAHRDATLLRFSLKEAIYKAIDPIVQRYVRFTEVEVDVLDDGGANVTLLLPEFANTNVVVEAHWRTDAEWIVSVARSTATAG